MKRALQVTTLVLLASFVVRLWAIGQVNIRDLKGFYNSHMYGKVIKHASIVRGSLNKKESFALNYMLAQSYMKLRFYLLAIHKFKSLLAKAPYQYEILNNIGACHYGLRKYKHALAYFSKSIEQNSNYYTAIKNYRLVKRYIRNKRSLPNIEESDAFADVSLK